MPILVQINVSLNQGSTGRIAEGIGLIANANGWDTYFVHGARYKNPSNLKTIQVDNKVTEYRHYLKTLLFDKHGLGSSHATRRLVEKLKRIKPDVIHLHVIHGHFINYKILFEYLIEEQIPTVWTLHDCWPFTGHCAYFDRIGCTKWKSGCGNCIQLNEFPKSILKDNSRNNFTLKASLYERMPNMILVPVSNWLGGLAEKSILGNRKIEIIHNGIDLTVFHPLDQEQIKKKYGLSGKFVILGVANGFGKRKGFEDFLEIAKRLPEYKIILIGLLKKEEKRLLPNMIGVSYTESIEQMVEYYAMADVFANPTYEDNFPTTNIEALACGAPVITYNTGGSPEAIDNNCGFIVEKGNVSEFVEKINYIKSKGKTEFSLACRSRAEENFDHTKQYNKYLQIYQSVI